ncbi:hypothetical protein TIFTF001_031438 [Ficus carica]|uniref:Uncharacterized protein n=1 Tax=Ficus carica TaxID=3494 RepID=A0AA88J5H7_FICCA|nr:hypothetical protein TIFTF001_031438 [Ficus carica]
MLRFRLCPYIVFLFVLMTNDDNLNSCHCNCFTSPDSDDHHALATAPASSPLALEPRLPTTSPQNPSPPPHHPSPRRPRQYDQTSPRDPSSSSPSPQNPPPPPHHPSPHPLSIL